MPTPSIQTLTTDAQQVLNLDSISAVRSVVAVALANANTGTPLNPNLTTQQLWNEFYQVVTKPKSDIESIIANQLMKFLYAPPAPGGVGADKQVIFNDGGVLAGDPQFLWDKTTNLLTVTGSATITGDLTVDTSTLKVDSANNRVGIGTASPTQVLTVRGNVLTTAAAGTDSYANVSTDGVQNSYLGFNNSGSTNAAGASNNNTYIGNGNNYGTQIVGNSNILASFGTTGVFNWYDGAGGTRMTLNSTGLGVGASPSAKLDVRQIAAAEGLKVYVNDTGATNIINFRSYDNTLGEVTRYAVACNGVATWSNVGGVAGTAMTLNANGLGIGVTPSAWGANYKAFQIGAQSCLYNALGYITSLNTNAYENSSGQIVRIANGEGTRYVQAGGSHQWFYAANASAGTIGGFTQAMTLDASGILVVGNTAAASVGVTGGWLAAPNSGNSYQLIGHNSGSASGSVYSYFFYNSSQIGSITQNGTTGVLYNITSDYRLKESVQPIANGLARVNALKPSIYKWKADGSNGEGFIAHELAEVVPFAVSGEKDAVNEDGSIKPQGIDMSRVVPILVAAIQELAAEVNALKNA